MSQTKPLIIKKKPGNKVPQKSLGRPLLKVNKQLLQEDYSRNLLVYSREAWQSGNWRSLVKIDLDGLSNHPDRAKIALIIASAHLQLGDKNNVATQFIAHATHWGCDKNLIFKILISGVYNTLGKAAALANQPLDSIKLFKSSIDLGPPLDTKLELIRHRIKNQFSQIKINDSIADLAIKNYLEINVDEIIKRREKEKSFFILSQKEKNRLQKIIDQCQTISGVKQSIQKKVFCIGSNKTGTTSLDSAMKILGFTSMPEELAYEFVSQDADSKMQERNFRRLMSINAKKFNFFEDLPFGYGMNYKVIREFYPEAKFILTTRDADAWFNSCQRWIQMLDCKSIYSWIWGIDFTVKNKKKIIELYQKRNSGIIKYFASMRTNQLFVLPIETASYDHLCKFLGVKPSLISNLNFPIENINDNKQ
jgi:hypothetical protein